MKSKAKGFTLIEVLVVLAIIGVLAAILVPTLVGYVGDSKYSTANANAKAVYTNIATWCTKSGALNNSAEDMLTGTVILTQPADVSEVVFDGTADDLMRMLRCNLGGKSDSGAACGEIKAQQPVWSQWKKNENDRYVGSYPVESFSKNPAKWGEELKMLD